MTNALALTRRAIWLPACALCMALSFHSPPAAAQDIDVSLNVFYADPMDLGSGGTWEIVAKTGGQGLASLQVLLTDIATAMNEAPRGIVNATNHAGFGIFYNTTHQSGVRNLTIGQAPLTDGLPDGETEQTLFYGVGTIENGMPGDVGPSFTTLTNQQDIPWAADGDAFGDSAWDEAATLASGAFTPGMRPNFFADAEFMTSGNVFTSVGTSTTAGMIASQITADTMVRSNFTGTPIPDYNNNGVVDAADYVLWRDGGPLMNEIVTPGSVTQEDYDAWRAQFGATFGAGSGGSLSNSSVPEPASVATLAIGLIAALRTRFRRGGRSAVLAAQASPGAA